VLPHCSLDLYSSRRELTLSFLKRSNDSSPRYTDILVDWEGVQHYVPKKLKHLVDFSAAADPRDAYKRLCSLAQNRVYFPDSIRTNRISGADLKDAYAYG
jgi:hypothetical protein